MHDPSWIWSWNAWRKRKQSIFTKQYNVNMVSFRFTWGAWRKRKQSIFTKKYNVNMVCFRFTRVLITWRDQNVHSMKTLCIFIIPYGLMKPLSVLDLDLVLVAEAITKHFYHEIQRKYGLFSLDLGSHHVVEPQLLSYQVILCSHLTLICSLNAWS